MTNQLPNGWITAPLINTIGINGTLCDGDWVESKDQDERGNIRLIQLADIGDGNFKNKSNRFINEDAFSRLGCTEINIGDILIARLPDPLGRACIFPNIRQRAVTVVDVCIIRTGNNSIDSPWLKYWINSPEVRRLIELQSSGTTRKRISRTKLESLTLPIPPLAEQKEIAARLDDLLAQVDTLKTRLDSIPNILKRFRQSVLAAAVSGKLTDRVGSWETVKLQNVATSRLGKMLDKQKNQGIPRPYLRNVNVRWNDFDLSDVLEMKMSDGEAEELTIKKGDILICEGGEPGRCAIWKENDEMFVYQKALHNVRVGERLIPEWLCFVLKDSADSHRLEEYFTGTTIKHFTGKALKEFTFLLPPLEEQEEIVRRVEELFAFADQVEQQVKAAQQRVNHLTQAILAKAFRGELTAQWREQNPDLISGENSAAALLARIKASNSNNVKASRRSK